jgi:hypothetical protein
MVKQQEFIEKNFEGISKSIDFLTRNKQVPVRKQKFNITPIPMETDEDIIENDIINNSYNLNNNVNNTIPTLEMSVQEQVINIDDVSDVNEELSMIENGNIEPVVEIIEDNIKEEEPIAIEVKQPELISVKDRKKKPKAK